MINSVTATKEQAELMLMLLERNGHKIREADYNSLHDFIEACIPRLPKRETVLRHEEARAVRKKGA